MHEALESISHRRIRNAGHFRTQLEDPAWKQPRRVCANICTRAGKVPLIGVTELWIEGVVVFALAGDLERLEISLKSEQKGTDRRPSESATFMAQYSVECVTCGILRIFNRMSGFPNKHTESLLRFCCWHSISVPNFVALVWLSHEETSNVCASFSSTERQNRQDAYFRVAPGNDELRSLTILHLDRVNNARDANLDNSESRNRHGKSCGRGRIMRNEREQCLLQNQRRIWPAAS